MAQNPPERNLPPTAPSFTPPPEGDWRAQRAAERDERRWERRERRGGSGAWVGGAVLILIGLALFLQNLNVPFLANWWALFILIPALGSFAGAWNMYQNSDGRLTAGVRGSFIAGLFFTVLALVFLFNINLGVWWPLLLVAAGALLLLNALLPG